MQATIIATIKKELSSVITEEVSKTLNRLREKIFSAIDVEDDLDIDIEKFSTNTAKKIIESMTEKMEEEIAKITKTKEKKEKKDPDAPKAAVNSFILFCRDNRQDIKNENPEMKATEITKKLGEMWKALDDEDKKEYQEKANEDKKRYAKEIEDYEPKEGFKNPKKSPKKESASPKRSLSAYIFFCNEKREEIKKKNPAMKATEIMAEMGKLWKALSDKKKKPYEEKAAEDKKRYEEEMKNYVPEDGEEKKKASPKTKNSRSPSAYLLFCRDNREEIKKKNSDLKPTEIMSKLGEAWKSISDKEKQKYNKMAEELKSEFEEKNAVEKTEEESNDDEENKPKEDPKKKTSPSPKTKKNEKSKKKVEESMSKAEEDLLESDDEEEKPKEEPKKKVSPKKVKKTEEKPKKKNEKVKTKEEDEDFVEIF
jgi:hypothetical protein